MKKHIKLISGLITLTIIFLLGLLSVEFLGEYGWTVFVFLPFLIGFLPPYISGYHTELSRKDCYGLSFGTLGGAIFGLLVFAMEGIICIVMASPILIILTLLGSYIAYLIHKRKSPVSPIDSTMILILSSIGFMGFDYANNTPTFIPVKTQVTVNAPIKNVWENVVTFNKIDEPTDWIFKTGISYPTDATIEGEGIGAVRYCNFTTGSFVEPITTWEPPTLLQFDVVEQPIPMHEWNPFWEVHPPHLDGYFQSYKGQFALTAINENTTQLEGTTYYKVDIQPEWYWKNWSDFIIHRIHERVLNHIKQETEDKK